MKENTQQQEEWRPVVGYEGLYEVSDLGRVRGLKRNRILRSHYNGKRGKYLMLCLCASGKKEKYFLVHRLVAESFISNCEKKPCVNHINNVSDDNRASNLEWVSYAENTEHGLTKGKVNRDRKGITCTKLDELQKSAIKCLSINGFSQVQISQLLDVPETTINSMLRKKV